MIKLMPTPLCLTLAVAFLPSLSAADPRLAGTWLKACGPAMDGTHYDIVQLQFDASTFNSSIQNFTDPGCTAPFPASPNPTARGTVRLGQSVTATGGEQVIEVDTHITSFNGAPFDITEYGVIQLVDGGFYLAQTDPSGNGGTTPAARLMRLDRSRLYARQ